jgi:hypothetical protein
VAETVAMAILLPVRLSVPRLAQARDQPRKNSSLLASPALTIKIDSAWAGFIRYKIKLRAAGFRLVYEVGLRGV